jgi:DNA repair exonuclease SbcCD nuclease subunit
MSKTLKKAALFTDIHYGAHNNSEQHNKDCLAYMDWFIGEVKNDPDIDHIIFTGDYFEHRASISGLTLHYSYIGAKKINQLGLPVYFITGNHDYFNRNNRDIHNTFAFEALSNFIVVNSIQSFDELGEKGAVLSPFLFEHEFVQLLGYIEYPVVFGHFEFKDFVITGDTIVKEHGPDHKLLKSFKRIMSGHYHKRQQKDNVVYIGNTFPTNFADANDTHRGMAKYTYKGDKIEFLDWADAPTYIRCKLSDVLAHAKSILKPQSTVQCKVDVDLSYEESLELKASLIKKYKLRELTLDEGFDLDDNLNGEVTEEDEDMDDSAMSAIIVGKLKTVSAKNIDNEKLITMFEGLNER